MFKQKPKIPKTVRRAPLVAILSIVIAVSFVAGSSRSQEAAAATSSTINFQARLLMAAGSVVPDGNYNVEFKLYNTASTGGTAQGVCTGNCVWKETRESTDKVRVANGYLTVNLGSVTAFGSTINWDQELWLTMNIGGTGTASYDGEMSPRLKLTAVPYAFTAAKLVGGTSSNTTTLDTGTPSGNNTISLPAESGTVCLQSKTSCGFALASGAGNYIQNGTTVQAAANFNIRSAAIGSVTGVLQGASGQTADIFQAQTWNGSSNTTVVSVGNTGLLTASAGLTATGTIQLNASGSGATTIGNSAAGAISITNGSSISVGTANTTSIGLGRTGIITTNNGALTVTQALTASGGISVAANQDVTLSSGTGKFNQTYGNNVTGSSAQSITINNTNSGASTIAIYGQEITTSAQTAGGGTNSVSVFRFLGPTGTGGNNTFTALDFATNTYSNVIRVNGTSIISGAGLIQNAAVDSTITYSNLTKVGALTAGSIASGFGTISTGNTITTTAAVQGGTGVFTGSGGVTVGTASSALGKIVFQNASNANTATIQSATTSTSYALKLPTALSGVSGDCLKDQDGAGQLVFTACGGASGTLQGAYNASTGGTTPEIKLQSTQGGVDVQDADTTIGATASLFAVRGSNGSGLGTAYLSVLGNGSVGVGGATTPSRTLDVSVSTSSTSSLPFIVQQAGTGDVGIEIKNPTIGYYVGIDSSNSSKFKITSSSTGGTSTFGYTADPSGLSNDSSNHNVENATKFTASASGTVTTLRAYVGSAVSASPNNLGQMAIYSDNGAGGSASYPATLLASSSSVALTSGIWNTFTISPVSVTSGTIYWLVYNTNGSGVSDNNLKTDAGSTNQVRWIDPQTFGTWASTWSSPSGNASAAQSAVKADISLSSGSDNLANGLFSMTSSGQAVFQNSTESANAFQILNTGSVPLFDVDTSNSYVYIGNPTSDTTGALLILDTKSSSGDPTGVNGGMYYNSNSAKLRCYENSSWQDCVSYRRAVLGSDVADSSGTCTFTNATGLSFSVTSGTTYRFRANITYTSAATTTGLGLAATGPSASLLSYTFSSPLTNNTLGGGGGTGNSASGCIASAVSTASTGNTATIEGLITPTASGTLQLTFATEVGASAITIKAGSTIEWFW
jgi:hypothetical protein